MRVRSHSMETMVGSHRHRSPGVGGGVPASLSGGGLPQSTSECTKSTFTVSSLQQDVTWAKSFGSCSFTHPYLMLEDFGGTFLKCCNTKRSQILYSVIRSLLYCQPSLPWRALWNGARVSSPVSTPAQKLLQTNTRVGRLKVPAFRSYYCYSLFKQLPFDLRICFLYAATKSLQRAACCPRTWNQRHHPIRAHLRSVPTKKGETQADFI